MIVDLRILNSLINSPPAVLPDICQNLHNLANKYFFTITDLSQAYFSVSLTDESKHLTRFATSHAQYIFEKLPQGLSSSPTVFQEMALKILHYTPRFDEHNKLIYIKPDQIAMDYDPIMDAYLYFDDLLIGTPVKTDYISSLNHHFEIVEKVMML